MSEPQQDFEPANHDHAIVDVRFAYVLAKKLGADDLHRARSKHALIRKELPAVILPSDNESEWLEFSYVRPDATAAWTLRLQEEILSVECTRYTRWDKVWATARRFLKFALDVAVERDAETALTGAAMMVTDKFHVLNPEYNLGTLLRPHDVIPPSLLTRRHIWHSHNGWMEADESRAVVNSVRLECARNDAGDGEEESATPNMNVTIQHSQQVVFRHPVSCSESGISTVAREFEGMHLANKRLVKELLTNEMSTRIGLETTI